MFEVRDGARSAVFGGAAGSPYALNDARAAAVARDKAFSAIVLNEAGLRVVPGRIFFATRRWSHMRSPGREPDDALTFARSATYPLFCKPISAASGQYAEVIHSAEDFGDYLARVGAEHYAFLAQPFIRAPEFRVLVLDGAVLGSYRKTLPSVVGDGVSTLELLVRPLDRRVTRAVGANGRWYAANDTPPADCTLTLEGPANRAVGGGASEVRDDAPEPLARLAIAATDALSLRFAGVDIFDVPEQGPTVIEVNASPMIATLEEHGRWDLIVEVWRANFAAALR